jgi:hypothetical protein
MNIQVDRQVIPVEDAFFNDGHWYVLTSTSLGGSGLTAKQLADQLQADQPEVMLNLADAGICLPIFFDGDCALDSAVIIVGELSSQESSEWFARIQAHLAIPCGEFMIMGGGLEEDFDVALNHEIAPDPHFVFFQKIKLPPGQYLLEIYAFLNSMSGAIIWERFADASKAIARWQEENLAFPEWLSDFLRDSYVDNSKFDLQDYIIRLKPLDNKPHPPDLVPEINWFGQFEVRAPEHFPRGILRSQLLAESVTLKK